MLASAKVNVKLEPLVTVDVEFATYDFVATVLSISNCSVSVFQSIPTPAAVADSNTELSIFVCNCLKYPVIDLGLIDEEFSGIIALPLLSTDP